MLIYLKNKNKLIVDDFNFKCSLGKGGTTNKKIEGDLKTPLGKYEIGPLYYRADKIQKIKTKLNKIKITKKFGWCNDINSKKYNKKIKITKKYRHEKLFRNDYKYDLLIPIKYNYEKTIKGKGSAIFLHLTKNYKPTAGCVAISKNDFFILLKLINKKTKIIIS